MADNIDRIVTKIISDAKSESEEIIRRNKAEAAMITSDAVKDAEKSYKASIASSTEDAAFIAQRALSSFDMQKRSLYLSLKQEILTSVYDRAMERLLSMPRNEYITMLRGYIQRQSVSCELVLNSKDREEIGSDLLVRDNVKLSEDTAEILGGVIIRYGNISENYSLEVILERVRELTESQVANCLFGEAE